MPPQPFRTNEPPADPVDPEELAISVLAARTRRLRSGIAGGAILVGLAVAGVLFGLFWDYYATRGLAIPVKMIAITSVTLSVLPAMLLAPRLSTLYVRARRKAWLAELARAHRLDLAELDEMTRSFFG